MKEACHGLWHPAASQRGAIWNPWVTGQLCQANCINRSLSALSDVLSALGDSSGNELPSEVLSRGAVPAVSPCFKAHIPFRNSKLTSWTKFS